MPIAAVFTKYVAFAARESLSRPSGVQTPQKTGAFQRRFFVS